MQDEASTQFYTYSANTAISSTGSPQPSQPEVIVHGDSLASAIKALGNDLETLRDRLHSVLRPDVPHDQNATSDQSPQPLRSPLSEQLVDTHSQVCSLGGVVSDLLNRLEV